MLKDVRIKNSYLIGGLFDSLIDISRLYIGIRIKTHCLKYKKHRLFKVESRSFLSF